MVTFSDVLSIRIGDEDEATMHDFQVHADAMESRAKPWSLHMDSQCKDEVLDPPIANQSKYHQGLHQNKHAWVTPVEHSTHAMNLKQPVVQQTSDPCRDPSRAEASSGFDSAGDTTWMSQCTQGTCNFDTWHAEDRHFCHEVLPQDSMANQQFWNDQIDIEKLPWDVRQYFNPVLISNPKELMPPNKAHHQFVNELKVIARLMSITLKSAKALLSGDHMVQAQSTNSNSKGARHQSGLGAHVIQVPDPRLHAQPQDAPKCNHARLEHESPIPPSMRNNPEDPEQDDEDMEQHDQPTFPAFVHNLISRMDRIGVDPYDNDFDLAVRTWYIDHRTIHRWTAPRLLQLMGPPQGWEAQIQAIWIDQINTDDWFDVIFIEPDPPRPVQHSFVVYDIVITQSLDMPRYAALITVLPGRANSFAMFSVACSLPEMVSGFDLIQAADAGRNCRHAECLITHRWMQIPNTLGPTHRVGQGNGYQIAVHDMPQRAIGHRADDTSSSDAITASPRYSPGRQAAASSSSQHARFTTILHLFQLNAVDISHAIVNDQRIQPTQEIADALQIPFDCLEALHVVPNTPYQIPEYEIAAVVQRTGDLAIRTTDRLLLVDIIYHHHATSEGVSHRPTLVREVQRVGHQILRQQILMAAAVHHYCLLVSQHCSVTLDAQLWPEDDPAPRPVRHGSYAQVVVPPPATHDVPTQTAVDVVQQVAEDDNALSDLFDMPESEDATFLTQLAATRRPYNFRTRKLPTDMDLPNGQRHDQIRVVGAVLQENPDLNPHSVTVQVSSPHVGAATVPTVRVQTAANEADASVDRSSTADVASESLHVDQPVTSTDSVKQMSGPPSLHVNRTLLCKQTKISQFFGKPGKSLRCPATKQTKQTKLTHFFAQTKTSLVADPLVPPVGVQDSFHKDPLNNEAHDCKGEQNDQKPTAAIQQARTGLQHESEPPQFEANIPNPPGPAQNAQPPRPIWHLELHSIFLEHGIAHHQETGPEISVEVWYVHHHTQPVCNAPRLIRLDDVQELWYADLCNAWFDQIQRQQPIKVHIVKPTPPYQLRPQAVVHIILEQGMTPNRVAILFTAAFHGGTRMGLLQQAESSPQDICTHQMIQDHGLQQQCSFRPCHLFSGRFRFEHHVAERVPSGISVLLDVGDHRTRLSHPASSSHEVPQEPHLSADEDTPGSSSDTMSLMQQPRYKAFPKGKGVSVNAPQPQLPQDQQLMLQIHQPLPATTGAMHQPVQRTSIHVRNLVEFHQMLQWQANRARENCLQPPLSQTQVATWFSNSVTLPRSDHSREVILSTQPAQWPQDILQRWADWLQPEQPVDLYVAQPEPPGGTPDILAHVLVVQNPPPDKFAVLVSVTELMEDPWHPSRFCTLLPGLVTREILFSQAGIEEHQVASTPGLAAYHGSTPIPAEGSYPARHGFTFEVITDSLDQERDVTTLVQLSTHRPVVHAFAGVDIPTDQADVGDGWVQRYRKLLDEDASDVAHTVQRSFQEILHAMRQIHEGLSTTNWWQASTLKHLMFPAQCRNGQQTLYHVLARSLSPLSLLVISMSRSYIDGSNWLVCVPNRPNPWLQSSHGWLIMCVFPNA